KAQQLEPKLYYGNVIEKTNAIVIRDSEETLMLTEESRSKMLLKLKDPIMSEKKVNTTPVDYAILNQLSQDFKTRFVPQTELSAEQGFWSQNYVNSPEPTPSTRPTKVEVPKELLKVSMDNIKKELEEIETINIELDHRVTKLIAENEHLKQTYKQLYDSIKSSRIRSKEQCDDLINQVNLKSTKNSDLNASLQEKVLLYDGNVIEKTNAIVIRDSEETLMLAEESRSKMLLKLKDPIMSEKKVNTTPVDYAILNQLSQDFKTRFVPQTKLSAEQGFWSQNSMNSSEPYEFEET
nr:pyruvate, phosphate dikinase regulatory protein, chloroplastic [Tanacetum cinerariifolium]